MEAYHYLAKVYDTFMSDVDYVAWATYLNDILHEKGAINVLEVACGTGNITTQLYRFGYIMTAADISTGMLKTASEKARKQGIGANFVQQDMRAIKVGNKVDAILSACDGPNYIDLAGLTQFAQSAYDALREKGVLLFDISTECKLKNMNGEVYFDDGEDAACIWHNAFNTSENALIMDITLFTRKGDLFERFTEQHKQFAHSTKAVAKVMKDAGFSRIDVYDFSTRKPERSDSLRAQFVCSKV